MEPNPESELFRAFENRLDEQARLFHEQVTQIVVDGAKDMLVHLYTDSAAYLARSAAGLNKVIRQNPEAEEIPVEELHRLKFEALGHLASDANSLLGYYDERAVGILGIVSTDADTRNKILAEAMQEGRNWWDAHLEEPDLNPDEILFGRRMLTHLNQKLEDLIGSQDQPQQP